LSISIKALGVVFSTNISFDKCETPDMVSLKPFKQPYFVGLTPVYQVRLQSDLRSSACNFFLLSELKFLPRKGYKRQAGRSVGMPERMEAQNFNRRISANEALILATVGNGSKTDGFRNLMCLFRELHNLGFKDFEDIRGLISKRQEIN